MLSATPVNNRFIDLKNQIALAYEGNAELIDSKLNTTRSIDDIFKNAQREFTVWSKQKLKDRTTQNLLRRLDYDFSELDRKRQNQLLGTIRDGQTLITCTGLDDFVDHRFQMDKVFHVVNGTVEREN